MNRGDPPSLAKLSAGGPPRGRERDDGLPDDGPVALTGGPGRDYSDHEYMWQYAQRLYNKCMDVDPEKEHLKEQLTGDTENQWVRAKEVLGEVFRAMGQDSYTPSLIFTYAKQEPTTNYKGGVFEKVFYPMYAATAWEIFASVAVPYFKTKVEPSGELAELCDRLLDAVAFEAMTQDEINQVGKWLTEVHYACGRMSVRVNTNVRPNARRNYYEPDDDPSY